jgi:hypothetical protein
MKTKALALVLFALALKPCRADDGTWSTEFTEAAGPVYAATENRDVSLESELLRFGLADQGVTEAAFLFRNAGTRELKVEAGFPVRVTMGVGQLDLPASAGRGAAPAWYLSHGQYGDELGLAAAQAFYGDVLFFDESEYPGGPEYGGGWYIRKDKAAVRRMVKAADFQDPFTFTISQDGTQVAWDTVFLESRVIDQRLELVFHFHHVLTFRPSSTSVVSVSYSQESLRGRDSGAMRSTARYGWEYVLGTGRTWRGSIGKLLLCVPKGATVGLPAAFTPLGVYGAEQLYLATDYEPAASDEVSLVHRIVEAPPPDYLAYVWFGENTQLAPKPTSPAQEFVKVRGASSALAEKVTLYTPEGVMRNMDFLPLRLFDGVRESAWVEGVPGDGIGEWVEFELTRSAIGLSVQNGFNMSFTPVAGREIETYYAKNNRVRAMDIASGDGKVAQRVELEDAGDRMQFFPIALPSGVYRLTVSSVYKGTKWADTCLGEIVFQPGNDKVSRLLGEDSFFREHF